MREKATSLNTLTAVKRYGLSVGSIAAALALGLSLNSLPLQGVEFPVFLLAVAVTIWYAGTWPGILALLLAALAFNYYFTEPRFSFYVTFAEIPYYTAFILFALLIAWFSALRRRVEVNLIQSRDALEREVAIRTQQA